MAPFGCYRRVQAKPSMARQTVQQARHRKKSQRTREISRWYPDVPRLVYKCLVRRLSSMFAGKGDPIVIDTLRRHGAPRRSTVSLLSVLLSIVGALLGSAAPASAAALAMTSIRADFDNDGIPDTVTVINDGRSSQVRVWLSHLARFRVLRIPDEIVSLMATDVNQDGRVDVRAATRRHGVLVWLNHGRGHLKRVKPASPTLAARHRFGRPGTTGSSVFGRWVGDDDTPSSSVTDFQQTPYDFTQTVRANARSPDTTSADDFSNTPPRAPPLG